MWTRVRFPGHSPWIFLGKINNLFRINLPLFSTVVPAIIFVLLSCRPFVAITTLSTLSPETEVTSTPTRPVDNVVIATKGLQDRSTNTIAGTTVENKGKLIYIVFLYCNNNNYKILVSFF